MCLAKRRHHTSRIIKRRVEDAKLYRIELQHPHTLDKTSALCCRYCRKKKPGLPKISPGICCIGSRDRIYRWRKQARELSRLARNQWFDWDSKIKELSL